MASDAYERRRGGEPHYFGDKDSAADYTYTTEPRNAFPPVPRDDSPSKRSRASQSKSDKMTTSNKPVDPPAHEAVSPELIAHLTEQISKKVKEDLVEHLKQTGTIDDQARSQPMQRELSGKSSSTSSPPPTGRYTPPSPSQSTRPFVNPQPQPPPPPPMSPPKSPVERPSGVRFSDREPRARPAHGRTYSTMELSTIDQKWGRLFDSNGIPTQRLGQFLRGLANHIVEDFHPKKSIVVTPTKMATYYTNYTLEKEPHPLLSIFRAQSNEQISQLFQDLGCQHFLVQEDSRKEPVVPALTPLGFAHWMTIQLLAYPEEESRRLEKVVLALPIDADGQMVDGKPERLPKQISRHLLPEKADRESRKILDAAITDFLKDLGTTQRRKGSITSPSLSRHSSTSTSRPRNIPVEIHQTKPSASSSTATIKPIERERKPYSGAPSDSCSSEDAIKIERDRQPYVAQPGNGRVYEKASSTASSNLSREKLPSNASSTVGREPSANRAGEQSEARQRDHEREREREKEREREPRHHRTQSNASSSYVLPPRANRRTSSPPIKNFSHSDADLKYGPPPTSSNSSFASQNQPSGSFTAASTSFPPPPPPVDIKKSHRMSRDYGRRPAEDEARIATGDFSSPRDTERWDRYQETATGRDVEYGSAPRNSTSVDPLDPPPSSRSVPSEDWYRDSRDREMREKPKASGYYGTRGGY